MENIYKKVSKELVEQKINEFFNKEDVKKKLEEISVKHSEWVENGQRYSAWQIGKHLVTGDGGMQLFQKAMEENFKGKKGINIPL